MTIKKTCFLNKERPCDLTCKAAFEVDDPIDNVDCNFLSLAFHFSESLFELRNMMQGGSGTAPGTAPDGSPFPGGFGGSGTPAGPGPSKGPSNN